MFQDVLMDFSFASILLVVASFLRSKVKVFQTFFIPVAVIAGLLGIILGPEVLGKFSPVYITWSENVNAYANPLLAILFVSQFLTLKVNPKMIKKSSLVFMVSTVVIGIQVASALPLAKMFNVLDGFALMPFLGFYGAHGLPGLAAGVYDGAGYWPFDEANSVGATFATFGMLWGVIGGIILINIAVRKGWTVNQKAGSLSEEELTGIVKTENRKKMMLGSTSGSAVNPIAFHMAVIGTVMILGYILLFQLQKIDTFKNFAIQIPAIIIALIVNVIGSKTKLGDMLDSESLSLLGGTALEFLIIISVATTNLTVVMNYGAPIIVIGLVGLILTTLACTVLSKLWIKKNWFENAMVMFGSWTGSTATGLMLLRVADPDMETDAGPNLMAATPFWQITTQSFFMVAAPVMIMTAAGSAQVLGISVGMVVAGLVLGFIISRGKE